ncbi:conserved hypothetical protein [Ricinus communis]|uniref:Uncharacterized protein n=1 Tax=Ricinus communis TaxID=3988 RepID=B9RI10_RICCO|nr:conserved hypothetical protein [Ricinus communis]
MAADVSSLFRVLSGYRDDRKVSNEPADGKSTASLITRDLLGAGDASLKDESQELDLDLQVPSGWEKRLDLKSGKVYLQRCNSSNSSLSYSDHRQQPNQTVAELQDLNFPPSPSKITLNLFEEGNLELKLVPSSPSSSPAAATSSSSNYQSVCTLDKQQIAGFKILLAFSSITFKLLRTSDKLMTDLFTHRVFTTEELDKIACLKKSILIGYGMIENEELLCYKNSFTWHFLE